LEAPTPEVRNKTLIWWMHGKLRVDNTGVFTEVTKEEHV
jgi:hypothetical protein